ncbi:MAG: cation diffusion facilitator family transporter [Euryarchaeota archaeon]|nr:cation diffusion facilitator family transporter [Euryarchaeota archaeon]MDE1835248.1 cation diffusion facilitator family transporter [Euryarchaeota archaeon]MDE1881090.1 cation diffusion facilitator family transporter [Euryarchaeota archaeon]MDE2043544.1 cation diffusion facilitator family transporter [Thermoplasmata archaeon]
MRTQLVLVASFALNVAFLAVNFVVFEAGGSHAVLSQAVNAATDLVAGLMILWGQRAAQFPASPTHPFGRGKERFFWAYSAGLVAFCLAGAFVMVFALQEILSPHPVGALREGLLTVAVTFAGNLASIFVVLLELRRDGGTVRALLTSMHLGVKTVFLQDAVSVLGGAVALLGLFLVQVTGLFALDGVAAFIVGASLLFMGLALARDGRELLVGRSRGAEETRALLALVEKYPPVRQVVGVQSMLLGPDDELVGLRVNFADDLSTNEVEMHIDRLGELIREHFPRIHYLLIEPESRVGEVHRPKVASRSRTRPTEPR